MILSRTTSSALILCSCPPSWALHIASGSSTSSPHHSACPRRSTRPPSSPHRTLATHTKPPTKPPNDDNNHDWPTPAKGHPVPTPYQIFDMKPHSPYEKSRYYHLVKLYHPDRPSTSLPRTVRIERYRLIVAAHALLSDPVSRSAYDRFGDGWHTAPSHPSSWTRPSSPYPSPGPFSQNWADPADPIWRNATWEDWERYHARQANGGVEPRSPIYMANSYFLAVVVALAAVGGSLNYGRAQDTGSYFVEQRDIVHDRAAKDLRRVRQETSSMGSREDRIDLFVRQREATLGFGDGEELREERARRVLGDQEMCSSGMNGES